MSWREKRGRGLKGTHGVFQGKVQQAKSRRRLPVRFLRRITTDVVVLHVVFFCRIWNLDRLSDVEYSIFRWAGLLLLFDCDVKRRLTAMTRLQRHRVRPLSVMKWQGCGIGFVVDGGLCAGRPSCDDTARNSAVLLRARQLL